MKRWVGACLVACAVTAAALRRRSRAMSTLRCVAQGPRAGARIVRDFYSERPDGIIGNDDCGQMSAWLVFATSGLYPMQPASGLFVLGAPLVRGATLRLPGRAVPRITASRGQPAGARLNGRAGDPLALRYADLVAGGTLALSP